MAESNPIIGRVLARYRILEEVGRGGMAVVYRGVDEALGREVAVKVLHAHLSGDEESRARLQREAQAVAKLRHDNILEIYDYSGPDHAESFIVTEFIRGLTLTAFLAKHRGPLPEMAELIVAEMAGALEHAHRFGVIHRDVKPENVMIRDDGRVKLTDFGIAQIVDKERLTATGQLIGSPAYLAPELVEGGRVDFRTDVFAVGIVLYRLVTGQLPFSGRNPHEVMKKIVDGRFAPPDQLNPLAGTQLSRIIGRALTREPAGRYPDMTSLRADLLADAAAAGLEDVRVEVAGYFSDPDGWERAARPRMGKALLANAKREAARGRRAAAVALAGRALALDPKDAGARALIDGIGRRRRVLQAAAALAMLALVGAGGFWGARHLPSLVRKAASTTIGARRSRVTAAATGERGQAASPTSRTPATGGASGAAGAGSTGGPEHDLVAKSASAARPDARSRPGARPAGAEAVRGGPRALTINVGPTKNVQIAVDAKPQGAWTPGTPIVVSAGSHVVEFSSKYCFPKTVKVGPYDRTVDVQLDWALAGLKVLTSPPDAQVLMRTRTGHRSEVKVGATVQLKVPQDSPDGRDQLTLSAVVKGYVPSGDIPVEIRAGLVTETKIVLQPRSTEGAASR